MDLKTTQLKDTYGNLLTIGTTAGSPTTGTLQNGDGEDISILTLGNSSVTNHQFILQDSTTSARLLLSSGDLYIDGDVDGVGNRDIIFRVDGGDESMRLESNGDISFQDTSNNEAFYWDASAGSLGLGTTSPSEILNVKSKGSTSDQITLTHSGNTVNIVAIGQASSHGSLILRSNSGVNKVSLSAAGNDSYILDSNVGIGTTSPGTNLHIEDSSGATLRLTTPASGGTSVIQAAGYDSANVSRFSSAIDFQSVAGSGTANGHIIFSTYPSNSKTERMRIDSSGNVGINNTSPSSFLSNGRELVLGNGSASNGMTIFSDSAGTGNLFFADGTTGDQAYRGFLRYAHSSDSMEFYTAGAILRMSIDSSGDIKFAGANSNTTVLSLNTTSGSDTKQLSLAGGGADSDGRGARFRLYGNNHASLAGDADLSTGNVSGAQMDIRAKDKITLHTNSNPSVTIDSSGNVGIGVTPKTGGNTWQHIQFGGTGNLVARKSDTTLDSMFANNYYVNSSNEDKRIITGASARLFLNDNEFLFDSAPSDTADSTVSFTTRMKIDSSGNVGIGTNSPNSNHKAHIEAGSGNNTSLLVTTTDNADVAQVIIGHDEGLQGGLQLISDKTNNIAKIRVTNSSQFPLAFEVRGSDGTNERMRIDPSGRLLVGTNGTVLNSFQGLAQRACFSATGDTMTVAVGTSTGAYTGIHIDRTSSDGKAISFERGNTDVGSISVTTTATAYNTSSDYRLKENVVELTGALDRVDQLNPSRFNFIADADKTVDGFLAHEVADVVPEAITGEKDATEEYEVTPAVLDDEGNVIEEAVMGTRPLYQGIDQSKLVPLLVGAIQELRAEIEQLKNQ